MLFVVNNSKRLYLQRNCDSDVERDSWLSFEEKAVRCLRRSWPVQPETQGTVTLIIFLSICTIVHYGAFRISNILCVFSAKFCDDFLSLLTKYHASCFWKVEVEILQAYSSLFKRYWQSGTIALH